MTDASRPRIHTQPCPIMIRYRAMTILLALAMAAALSACDGDDSPPVTMGAPPAPQSDDSTGEASPPLDGDEIDGDEIDGAEIDGDKLGEELGEALPEASGLDGTHAADLPEGTDEQTVKYHRARTAFLSDQYEEAEELFAELARQEPVTNHTVSSAVALAQIYLESGRTEEAKELFDDIIEHIDELPEVLLVLGRIYADLGEPMTALGAFDRAYSLQQDYIFILPEMAQILLSDGEEEKAIQILRRYEERLAKMVEMLEDTDETPDRTRLYLVDILGVVHDDSAHRALEYAVANDPVPTIRSEAAVALGELGAVEARDTLRKAAVDDESENVRRAARHGLERLRELDGQPAVE